MAKKWSSVNKKNKYKLQFAITTANKTRNIAKAKKAELKNK